MQRNVCCTFASTVAAALSRRARAKNDRPIILAQAMASCEMRARENRHRTLLIRFLISWFEVSNPVHSR
jgi:hypothetical protein